jgi:peroxiredoxin
MTDFTQLPTDLPHPIDDGACDHLAGLAMPSVRLPSTAGRLVNLGALGPGRTVIYGYPRTGRPGQPLPTGWDLIPGARGCTPQSCAFRDHHRELADLGAEVYGLSTQTTEYQREMAERLHLPFEVLSDARFALTDALRLPTFEVDGMRLIKRLTLIIRDGRIEHLFYPVFPPNESAVQVIGWLERNPL